MDELEKQVRQALTNQTEEECYNCMMRPEYKAGLIKLVSDLCESTFKDFLKTMKDDKFGTVEFEQEKSEDNGMPTEMIQMINLAKLQIGQMYSDPAMVRQFAKQNASFQYKTKEELKEMFAESLALLPVNDPVASQFAESINKALGSLYVSMYYNNRIVARTVELARTEGLENAVKRETQNKIVKELFPTPQDYMTQVQNGFKQLNKFIEIAKNGFSQKNYSEQEETAELAETLIGLFQNLLVKADELSQNYKKQFFEEKIKEIYGAN